MENEIFSQRESAKMAMQNYLVQEVFLPYFSKYNEWPEVENFKSFLAARKGLEAQITKFSLTDEEKKNLFDQALNKAKKIQNEQNNLEEKMEG